MQKALWLVNAENAYKDLLVRRDTAMSAAERAKIRLEALDRDVEVLRQAIEWYRAGNRQASEVIQERVTA